MKINPYPCLINSKWTKDLNFKPEALKLVENSMRERLRDAMCARTCLWDEGEYKNFLDN